MVNEEQCIFKEYNKYIDDEDFMLSIRNSYFKYLVNNYLDIIYQEGFEFTNIIPETIKKRTLDYLSDCDSITY